MSKDFILLPINIPMDEGIISFITFSYALYDWQSSATAFIHPNLSADYGPRLQGSRIHDKNTSQVVISERNPKKWFCTSMTPNPKAFTKYNPTVCYIMDKSSMLSGFPLYSLSLSLLFNHYIFFVMQTIKDHKYQWQKQEEDINA